MNISPDETNLVGKWLFEDGRVTADPVLNRIKRLTEHVLRRLAIHPDYGAWETLYQDPEDGRVWEKTFPQGEMHGGGPAALVFIERARAEEKYRIRIAEGATSRETAARKR